MYYILIGLVILLLSFHYDFSNKRHKYKNLWFNLILIILIYIPAFRFRVGGDTLSYMDEYAAMPSIANLKGNFLLTESRYQPLWILFIAMLKSISPSFLLFQIVHAVIINSLIFHIIKKYAKFLFFSIFVFYIYSYFRFNFEILREALSISVFALSINACLKRNWLHYIIYVIIAYLFHDSAMILFILPFLYEKKLNIYLGIVLVTIGIVFFFKSNLIFERLLSTGLLSTRFILRSYAYIESNDGFSLQGIFYYLSIFVLFPMTLFYIGYKNGIRTAFDGFLLFYVFIGIISSLIPGLYRFANYQIILSILYLSSFFDQIRIRKIQNRLVSIHRLLLVCVLSIILTNRVLLVQFRDTSDNYPGTRYYNLYYPYYSVFNPVIYNPREQLVYNMWYKK